MKRAVAILLFMPVSAVAEEALVAVATNFQPVLERLRDDFEAATNHTIELSGGSTGVLYAQVVNGAPYDAFFAADQLRPRNLESNGAGVTGTRFTYAEGRLAFWSIEPSFVHRTLQESLSNSALRVLAIANPRLAPYGSAAKEAVLSSGHWDGLNAKLVYGENVGQAYSMAATGNADAGLVALSAVLLTPDRLGGAHLEISAEMHAPILQDAILLQHGSDNVAAIEFLNYLQSDAVRKKIVSFGYQ